PGVCVCAGEPVAEYVDGVEPRDAVCGAGVRHQWAVGARGGAATGGERSLRAAGAGCDRGDGRGAGAGYGAGGNWAGGGEGGMSAALPHRGAPSERVLRAACLFGLRVSKSRRVEWRAFERRTRELRRAAAKVARELQAGGVALVVGPSGAGKSVLMRELR